MSETNLFFHAITEALNAHIERAVAEATKPLLARIEALENNPAIGVDTTLEARVKVLEERPAVAVDTKQAIEELNNTEWFWDKINAYIETGIEDRIERAIDNHCECYDHDNYDTVASNWADEDPSDFVKDYDIAAQINDALRSASFDVRVTL